MLAVLTVGMMFCANAQESGFGVRASMNLSNVNNKYDGEIESGASKSEYEYDFKNRIGFKIGVIYDWGLSESFTFSLDYTLPHVEQNTKTVMKIINMKRNGI